MTSEELIKMADEDSREFCTWLRGYLDGMASRPANYSDVYQIVGRVDALQDRWQDQRNRGTS